MDERKPKPIWVSSIYGTEAERGLVEINLDGKLLQIVPEEARSFAMNLLRSAEAAEADECLIEFAKESGLGLQGGFALVHAFRRHRGHYHKGGHEADRIGGE